MCSLRIVVALASILGFKVRFHDVTQAYVQSDYKLERPVYIKSDRNDIKLPEFQTLVEDKDELLINLHLYGLFDLGDAWYKTIDKHLRVRMGLKSCTLDKALYFKQFVDDSIECGTTEFETLSDSTLIT